MPKLMNGQRAATVYAFNPPKQESDRYELYIYDTITKYGDFNWETWEYEESETSANRIREYLAQIPDNAKLDIHINSNGGEVSEAVAIYNLLCQKNCYKTAYVDGVAHSAAFILLFACDWRIAGQGTACLFHNMWMSVAGNAQELRNAADRLDAYMQSNRQIYLSRSKNLTEEDMIRMMDAETILTPDQCLEYGFIDEIKGFQADPERQMQCAQDRIDQLKQLQQMNDALAEQMRMFSQSAARQQDDPPAVPEPKTPDAEEPKNNNTEKKAFMMMDAFLNAIKKS